MTASRAIKGAAVAFPILAIALYAALLAAVWFMQDHLLFGRRTQEHVANPASREWVYEDVWVESAGERTHGWWIPLDNAAGAVLFSHGSGRNVSGYLEDAALFRELNLSVLLYDYGGYGLSEGSPSEARCRADARAMWNHLVLERNIPPDRIIVAGSSLGGGPTADLAASVEPAAVLLESTYTSIPDVVSQSYPFIPAKLLCRTQFRNLEKIQQIGCPIMIVHSRDDTVIPFEHGQRLFERAAEPKRFLEIHGAHYGGKFSSKQGYLEGLRAFLFPGVLSEPTP